MPQLLLNGHQKENLQEALRMAFNLNTFKQMLYYKLEKNLFDIAAPGNFPSVITEVIETAEQYEWTYELVMAARESNPRNSYLADFARGIGITVLPADKTLVELESMVRRNQLFIDFGTWLIRAGKIESQVCRIEIENEPVGTGFLIGPDQVMTNYHVVEDIKHGYTSPSKVTLRFNHCRSNNGQLLNPGVPYSLHKNWLIGDSPYSPVDKQPTPKSGCPTEDELDYAVLRLDGAPGIEPAPSNYRSTQTKRGWVEIPTTIPNLQPNISILFIVQHPKGDPMQLAAPDIMQDFNANRTRITYSVNTENGSSGSPVFNNNWDLVALHHAGEKVPLLKAIFRSPTYNEGIPMDVIRTSLKQKGIL